MAVVAAIGIAAAPQAPAPAATASSAAASKLAPTGGRGLTEVHGIKVGHHTLTERPTGCTVILVDGEGVPGWRLAAWRRARHARDRPARIRSTWWTRSTRSSSRAAALTASRPRPARSAGSRNSNMGWPVGDPASCRSCPAAILMDLRVRRESEDPSRLLIAATRLPTQRATGPVAEGNVGAGAGATVGKMGGGSMKGGIGSAAITLPNGLVVAAIVAVNAVGDIIDPDDRQGRRRRAHRRRQEARRRAQAAAHRRHRPASAAARRREHDDRSRRHQRAADQDRDQPRRDDGRRRVRARDQSVAHRPATATRCSRWRPGAGRAKPTSSMVGALAAEAMAEAIVRAVSKAETLAGVPSAKELGTVPARIK